MGDESAKLESAVRDTAETQRDATTGRRIVVPDEVRATLGLPAAERAAALQALAEPGAGGESLARGETAVALFEMHMLPPAPYTGIISMELTVDLTAHTPYRILGGTLGGDIYSGPRPDERWEVFHGTVGVAVPFVAPGQAPTPAQLADNSLSVDARRVTGGPPSSGEAEAKLVDNGPRGFSMTGYFWPPATYQGVWTYGQGIFAFFPSATLFMGWQASPPL